MASATTPQQDVLALLAKRLKKHSILTPEDEAALGELDPRLETTARGVDLVRQGDRPDVSVFVLKGMVARYQTLAEGGRQYLSLHIAGDLPDLQSLFLQIMDHSVMALDAGEIALFPHTDLRRLILCAPSAGIALWRQTLIDAAMFRQAITNNGQRAAVERIAHVLCETFTRTHEIDLCKGQRCPLPLSQSQLGQLTGLSLVTVNRALQTLKRAGLAEVADGALTVLDWDGLQDRAGFDPGYLQVGRRGEAW